MTRGLYPPDTLTKDNIQTLNQVRKDLWYNSLIGGGELDWIEKNQHMNSIIAVIMTLEKVLNVRKSYLFRPRRLHLQQDLVLDLD